MFFRDTRFLSELRLRVNGQWPEPLAATTIDPFSAAFVLRDQPKAGQADSQLMVFRNRYVGRGMREDITVRNYGLEPAFCSLEFLRRCRLRRSLRSQGGPGREGRVTSRSTSAKRHSPGRTGAGTSVAARASTSRVPPKLSQTHAVYEIIVPAGGEWSVCVQLTPIVDGEEVTPRYLCGRPGRARHARRSARSVAAQPADASRPVTTRSPRLLARSTEDLAALRLFDPEYPDRTVVAAGAPWFMTLFGRDSLITSWMSMMVDSDLALGTLQTLARYQGTEVNPLTEEEPGKILHEMRFGESAELSLGGGRTYYGSVDATPLFVMLLGELRRWGNRREEVDALLPAADRALAWIDDYGDRDGDGYVEYLRTSDRGLANQGWKDSHDSTRFADGRLAEPPIALCEVQGYVYAALIARAHFADRGRRRRARRGSCGRAAADLKARFNRDFWLEDRGWLAMGLDRDKRPLDALTSNMGHCLWTGILDEDKALDGRQAPRVGRAVLGVGHPDAGDVDDRASTRSATTTAACGRTTTRSVPPG